MHLTDVPPRYPIKETAQLTPQVRTYAFDVSFNALPGQFLMVDIPGAEEIPLSVAEDDGRVTQLAVFAVGPATRALAERHAGDPIGLRGPYGTHFTWQPGQHVVLIAGGYGSAPLKFTARRAAEDGCRLTVILAAKDAAHLLFRSELEALPNTSIHPVTEDGSLGQRGIATDVLEELIATGQPVDRILSCGPEMMLKHVSDIAHAHGIPAQVSLSRVMHCGTGHCGSCRLDPPGILLCKQGPVLENAVARSVEEFGVSFRDAEGNRHFFAHPDAPLHH